MTGSSVGIVIKESTVPFIAKELINHRKTGIFATGITTGYEVADNQLREFVITNAVAKYINEGSNHKCELILINDTLDPFTELYFKRLLKFDKTLDRYSAYVGKPIAHIPSPYGTHVSLAEYFQELLVEKLNTQGLFPKIIATHQSYKTDYYKSKIKYILEHEADVKELIHKITGKVPETLYRPICHSCGRIDKTSLNYEIREYNCGACGAKKKFEEIPEGKLIWYIDCAMRWNANRVSFEAFTNNYLHKNTGTYFVSCEVSKQFIDDFVPATVQFAYYKYTSRLNNLFLSLPYEIIEEIFIKNPANPDFIGDENIVNYSKSFMYGKYSLYVIAQDLYIFHSAYTMDHATLNNLNNVLFGVQFRSDVDNYKILRAKIDVAINFARKFIKPKYMLLPLEAISLPSKISKEECEAMKKYFTEGRGIGKHGALLYRCLFNSSCGPKFDMVNMLLPIQYRQRLIKLLEECQNE